MTRNAKYEQRMKEKGFKKVTLWVPVDREADIKHAASVMCDNDNLTVGVLKDTTSGRMVSIRDK
ncbi:hypothetical protein [Vibrio furnissii]|uniref:hypothetical protein n=1 Tax=Vibrio furnissii TaxID=29494 RepID=UPI0011801B7A|nr:hypothetical protein [Vibrio furnissii]MCG6230377.1 hypothetical protein [Vibrio furnissii]TRN22289.1 hypothetical protein DM784_17615 [Vibrio furnissii]UHJ61614.1 hypothetical protein LUM42_07510 [Vibrio furnissii]WJG23880.1 hypothetical protein QSU95_23055 [Vibrio furnissii]